MRSCPSLDMAKVQSTAPVAQGLWTAVSGGAQPDEPDRAVKAFFPVGALG